MATATKQASEAAPPKVQVTDGVRQMWTARRVSTSLIAMQTADPAAVMENTVAYCKTLGDSQPPLLRWDLIRGLVGLNPMGMEALKELSDNPNTITNPTSMLALLASYTAPDREGNSFPKLLEDSVVFVMGFQRWTQEISVLQGLWNLRDEFRMPRRTLVMLGPQFDFPAELAQDVMVIDEPLPKPEQLGLVIDAIILDSKRTTPDFPDLDDETRAKAIQAVAGLAVYPAEQSFAMSLSKQGVNISDLWERKRRMIEQTKGLSVWRGGETMDDIRGIRNVVEFLVKLCTGEDPRSGIFFIDEIDKSLGNTSDVNVTEKGQLGKLLSWMQDTDALGVLLYGIAGTGKSLVAKAIGGTLGIPTIACSLQDMKGSLVGESEGALRQALKVTDAVAQGRVLVIATCNRMVSLPPELRRRFQSGIFFHDVPTPEERTEIWNLYLAKRGIDATQPRPNDDQWTGAEIANCVSMAWRMKISLFEAAQFVVPVAISSRDEVDRMRQEANGTFLSASKPGFYQYGEVRRTAATNARKLGGRRAIELMEDEN